MFWNNKIKLISYCGVTISLIILLKIIYLNIPFVYIGVLGISSNAPEIYIIPLFFLVFLLDFKHYLIYSLFLYITVAIFSSLIVWVIVPLTLYVGSIFFDYTFVFLAPLIFIPFSICARKNYSKFAVLIGILVTHLLIFATHSCSSILFFSTLKLHSFGILSWALLYNVGYVFINCLISMITITFLFILMMKSENN